MYEDEYEGAFENRLSIVWTLNFTMRLNFYSNVANQSVIKKTIADIYNDPTMSLSTLNDRLRVTAEVNPSTATPEDAYTFLEQFDESFE